MIWFNQRIRHFLQVYPTVSSQNWFHIISFSPPPDNSIIILLFPPFTNVTCIFDYFAFYSNRYTPWLSHLHPHSTFFWFFVKYFVLLARRHFPTHNHNLPDLPDLPSRVSNNSLVPALLPPTPTPHSTIIY